MLMKPSQFEIDGSLSRAAPRPRPGFLTRLVMKLEAYAQYRRQRQQLLALDDHLLKDIGIGRAEAASLASQPFDPQRRKGRSRRFR
jgi:uncharacterized protein YjiS (DUF1127 family)